MGEGAVRLHIEDCDTENVNHGAQLPLGLGRECTVASKRPNANDPAPRSDQHLFRVDLRQHPAQLRESNGCPSPFLNAVADATVAA